MDMDYLLYGNCEKGIGGLFNGIPRPMRTVYFTTDKNTAIANARKHAQNYDDVPAVVLLKDPSRYEVKNKVGVPGCYRVYLGNIGIDLKSDDVELLSNPEISDITDVIEKLLQKRR